jgi:hypothetical protein
VLPVHPAADLFPLMSRDELIALANDIEKNGLRTQILFWAKDHEDWKRGKFQLLDGRNRLDAMEVAGIDRPKCFGLVQDGKPKFPFHYQCLFGDLGHDPYTVVISTNIHRRHLTAEQRRDLIANVLKAKPELSDRAIAKQVKADGKTVAKVRAEQANADVPHTTERTEASGRKARGRKPKKRDLERERRAREDRKLAARGDPPPLRRF